MKRLLPHRKRTSFGLPAILIVLVLFLSLSAFRDLFGFRSLLGNCLFPFQLASSRLWQGVISTPGAVFGLKDLASKNVELNKELAELKAHLLVLQGQVEENQRLKAALNFYSAKSPALKFVAARVIGKSPSPWFSLVQLDKGQVQGLKVNSVVITPLGLVGRLVEVSAFSSKALLLTDRDSSVAAVDASSRDFGTVVGGYFDKLVMKYVGATASIKVGDQIVTSQVSTYFPPGILIGTVTKASKRAHDLFYSVEIKPAVDFKKIEEVFVLL